MSNAASWIFLLIAGLLEICWAIGLKYTEGFTKLIPSIFTVAIPIGTAYGVWRGIGALSAATLRIILFHESA